MPGPVQCCEQLIVTFEYVAHHVRNDQPTRYPTIGGPRGVFLTVTGWDE